MLMDIKICNKLKHDVVRLQLLRVSGEPQSPVLHLYLVSSSGSRDKDVEQLRKIVSLVSLDTHILIQAFLLISL